MPPWRIYYISHLSIICHDTGLLRLYTYDAVIFFIEYYGCRVFIYNIYQRLCEAGCLLNYGLVWIGNAKMGEKIIQPPTNNVDYN